MKKIILLASAAVMMFSCGEKKTTNTYAELTGEWFNTQYTQSLAETNSTKAAQGSCETTMVIINDRTVMEIINLHEGSDKHPLDSSTNGFSYTNYKQEIRPVKLSNDTLSVGELKFVRNKFKTIVEMINSSLIVGQYTLPNGTVVEFLKDGKLNGMDGFDSYYITYDCIGSDYDLIKLKGSDKSLSLHFVIKPTEVVMYNVEFEDPQSEFGTIIKDEYTRLTKK